MDLLYQFPQVRTTTPTANALIKCLYEVNKSDLAGPFEIAKITSWK